MAGLENGTRFPPLVMATVGGPEMHLPRDVSGSPAAILAYRGSWCSRCNAQLASFQKQLPEFAAAGIEVAAFSADDEAHARLMVEDHGITFPVGYGVLAVETGAILQGYINKEHSSLESSNFILRPDGTIEIAIYSSGSIGRLLPEDALDIVLKRRERWSM